MASICQFSRPCVKCSLLNPIVNYTNRFLPTCFAIYNVRHSSELKRKSIKDVHENKPIQQNLRVQGWIKGIRRQKERIFLDLDDRSTDQVLQVVADSDENTKKLTAGACIDVAGKLAPSAHPKQEIELKSNSITTLGPCDQETYPFRNKKKYSLNYLRQFLHLRPRTKTFIDLFKIRNAATMALHSYYQRNGYCLVHTPILTSNDCEGAGDVFSVNSGSKKRSEQGENDSDEEMEESDATNSKDIFLTVSGQLQLECFACGGLPKTYTFGPVFRAEDARSKRHLNEFYMVEAELAFTKSLEDIMEAIEDMVKETSLKILTQCSEELRSIEREILPNHQDKLRKIIEPSFARISYSDAIAILTRDTSRFKENAQWGISLKREHEEFIVKHCGGIPVFVTNFPAVATPFYMKSNNDVPETVAAVDLLVPDVGELCGGSLREDNIEVLQNRMNAESVKSLEWYLDLRRYGSVPHGGYGMGFERYLRFLTGVRNIRDTIPFPRWSRHCPM